MITDYIPQRAPILMVDDVHKMDDQSVKTSLCVQTDNWFYKDGVLLEAGIIEHMAQSAAVMVGMQSKEDPKEGYIGDIRDFTICRLPKLGETIESIISIVTQLDNVTIIVAKSFIQEKLIANARIKVFIEE